MRYNVLFGMLFLSLFALAQIAHAQPTVAINPSTTQVLDSGQNISFGSTVSGGTPPYVTYDWLVYGSPDTCSDIGDVLAQYGPAAYDVNPPNLTIYPSSTAYYCLEVEDSATNTGYSGVTEVEVNTALVAPTITSPASPTIMDVGQSLLVSSSAASGGTPGYNYSWTVASGMCPGFSNPGNVTSFHYVPTGATASCTFQVTATDSATTPESATSSNTTVITVGAMPTLTDFTPSNATLDLGQSETYNVLVSGGTGNFDIDLVSQPNNYYIQSISVGDGVATFGPFTPPLNGGLLGGQTDNNNYYVNGADIGTSDEYYLSSVFGAITVNPTLLPPSTPTVNATSIPYYANLNVSSTLPSTGTPPYSYQWLVSINGGGYTDATQCGVNSGSGQGASTQETCNVSDMLTTGDNYAFELQVTDSASTPETNVSAASQTVYAVTPYGSFSPSFGPDGTQVTFTAGNLVPLANYNINFESGSCAVYTTAAGFTANSTGAFSGSFDNQVSNSGYGCPFNVYVANALPPYSNIVYIGAYQLTIAGASTNHTMGVAYENISLSASGMAPDTAYDVYFDTSEGTQSNYVGTCTSDSSGDITGSSGDAYCLLTVPSIATGAYYVDLFENVSTNYVVTATQQFTVLPQLTAPSAPSVSAQTIDADQVENVTGTIPSTGVPTYSYTWLVSVNGSSYSDATQCTANAGSDQEAGNTIECNITANTLIGGDNYAFELQVSDNATTPEVTTSTNSTIITVYTAPTAQLVIPTSAFGIDGSNVSQFSGQNYGNITLSTSSPNDVIIAYISYESGTYNDQSHVVSVTDSAGLTWHRRSMTTLAANSSGEGIEYDDLEVWYAIAPEPLSGDLINATFNGTMDDGEFIAFGVSDANIASPWDPNPSLPSTANDPNGFGGDAITIVSTNSAPDMLLGFVGNDQYCDGEWTGGLGFTTIESDCNGGGELWWGAGSAYEIVNSTQTSTPVNMSNSGGPGASDYWSIIGDAIQEHTASAAHVVADQGQAIPYLAIASGGTGSFSYTWDNSSAQFLIETAGCGGSDTMCNVLGTSAPASGAFNVLVTDTGTSPGASPTATANASSNVTINTAPYVSLSVSNYTMDQGQTTVLNATVYAGTGPFTLSFYNISNSTTVATYSNVSAGTSVYLRLVGGVTGTFYFNVSATDDGTTLPYTFNSTTQEFNVSTAPSITAPEPSNTTPAVGQYLFYNSTISGGTGPFTVALLDVSNDSIMQMLTGQSDGLVQFTVPIVAQKGANTYNVVAYDTGTEADPFEFNSPTNTIYTINITGITYNGSVSSETVTAAPGYKLYVCNGANWEPTPTPVSWTVDINNSIYGLNGAVIGHTSNDLCQTEVSEDESLSIFGTNDTSYSIISESNFNESESPQNLTLQYTLNKSTDFPKSFSLIEVACGDEACPLITAPAGCTPLVEEGVNSTGFFSLNGTSYTALCSSQNAGTYNVTLNNTDGGVMAFAVYLFKPPTVTITPSLSQSIGAYASLQLNGSVYGGTPLYTFNWLVETPSNDTFVPISIPSAALPSVLRQINTGNDSNPYGLAYDPFDNYLFAADSNTGNVSVINATTGVLLGNVSIPDSCPDNLGLGQNGNYLFVTDICNNDNVYVINTTSLTFAKTLSITGCDDNEGPEIATLNTTQFAYISNNCGTSLIYQINTTSASITNVISDPSVFEDLTSIAITSGGANVITNAWDPCDIVIVNTSTGDVLNSDAGNACSLYEDPTPDGTQVWFGYADTIAVFNTTTESVTTHIDLGPDTTPTGVAFSPDGKYAYVGVSSCDICYYGGTNLSVVDVGTLTPIANVSISGSTTAAPWDVVTTGSGKIFVSQGGEGNVTELTEPTINSTLLKIKSLPSVQSEINTGYGSNPWEMAFSPNNDLIYAADNGNSNVSVISTFTGNVVATINLPSSACPNDLAVVNGGAEVYVTDQCDLNDIWVLNTSRDTLVGNITTYGGDGGFDSFGPFIAASPTQPLAYVTDDCQSCTKGNVTVIDTTTGTVANVIEIPGTPDLGGITFSENGTFAYVSGVISGRIYTIDTQTDTVVSTTPSYGNYEGSFYANINPSGSEIWFGYPNAVAIFNTSTESVIKTFSLSGCTAPFSASFSLNGQYAYLASENFCSDKGTLSTYNATTGVLYGNVTIPGDNPQPWDVLTNPLTGYIYVSQGDAGNVTVLSPAQYGKYEYELNVTDSVNSTVTSELNVTVGPTLTAPAQSATSVRQGQSVTFTSTASGGTLPYSEGQLFYATNIIGPYTDPGPCRVSGSTTINCTFSPTTSMPTGTYYIILGVHDSSGSGITALSSIANVLVTASSASTTATTTISTCASCGATGVPPSKHTTTIASATTSPTTTVLPIKQIFNATNATATALHLTNTSSVKVDLKNSRDSFTLSTSQNASVIVTITNVTKSSTVPPPANTTAVGVFNVSLQKPAGVHATIDANISYTCGTPSGQLAPYLLINGVWTQITQFSVDPGACTISFSVTVDAVVAVFQKTTPVSTTETVSTTTVPTVTTLPQPPNGGILVAAIAIIILAIIAAVHLLTRRPGMSRRRR